jgi:polyphenol oxidase
VTLETAIARPVSEVRRAGDVPLWVHPEWSERFPWLVQGTTGVGDPSDPFDLGLAGRQPVGAALDRWRKLGVELGMPTLVHSRQVHAAEIWSHEGVGAPGIVVMDGYDGHVTSSPGLLMAVGIADCVPVSVVGEHGRWTALLHAGWRGTAAGIIERGVALLRNGGCAADSLWLHCGPAICGTCYEVGPEVHAGVNPHLPVPQENTPIDLRAAIAQRAVSLGIPAAQVSVSEHCTRCGIPEFFSHRAGSPGRQMGILGIRRTE